MNARIKPVLVFLVLFPAFFLTLAPSASDAARRTAFGKSVAVEREDGLKFVSGIVESAGPGYVVLKGHRYDTTRAAYVLAGGKPTEAGSVRRGSKVSLTLRGGNAIEVVVNDPTALE